jgi:hypothetical protein
MGTFVHLHALRSTIPGCLNPTGAALAASTVRRFAQIDAGIRIGSMGA